MTLKLTVTQVLIIISWVLDIRLLIGTALLLMLMPRALTDYGQSDNNTKRNILIAAATWISAIIAAFVAASWAVGINLPDRTLNGIYIIFLTRWFWILVMLVR